MRAVILTGGEIYDYTSLDFKTIDYIICADGGARHAVRLGVRPNILMGDFDTLTEGFDDIPRIKYPTEKDETDTFLAADYAVSEGFCDILIVGALGGRADHSLANIFILKYMHDKGVNCTLFDGKNRVFLKSTGFEISEKGLYVSLFPLFSKVEGLTLEGMKYPLNNYTLPAGSSLCISNEVVGEHAHVTFKSGILLVMLCRD